MQYLLVKDQVAVILHDELVRAPSSQVSNTHILALPHLIFYAWMIAVVQSQSAIVMQEEEEQALRWLKDFPALNLVSIQLVTNPVSYDSGSAAIILAAILSSSWQLCALCISRDFINLIYVFLSFLFFCIMK